VSLRFILHRPRSSQNIGSAARALANTGAAALWVVEPVGYDRAQAARLAAGADAVLEQMQVVTGLDEALGPCVDVVMTTGRAVEGLPSLTPREAAERLLSAPGPAALVFGDEVRGLTNQELRRAGAVATIPTVDKSSLNLAQAVLIFGYEVMLARGNGRPGQELLRAPPKPAPELPPPPAAEEQLLALLRARAQALLLGSGFLNPQQPDTILDELMRLLRRGQPSRREAELLLAACSSLARRQSRSTD
jgi:TrmH family RNA methyltransferase